MLKHKVGDVVTLLPWDELAERARREQLFLNGITIYIDGVAYYKTDDIYGETVKIRSVMQETIYPYRYYYYAEYWNGGFCFNDFAIADEPLVDCPIPTISFDELFSQQ